jgi:uncharacterized protein YbbK (DUF523 family)
MILLSACLVGVACRYDGSSAVNSEALHVFRSGEALAVCPEELGGLSTPRSPAQFIGGTGNDVLNGRARILTKEGMDVTEHFVAGAEAVLRMARELGLSTALFKARSPACGKGAVYCEGRLVTGHGVCTALLLRSRCKVRVVGE